MRIGEAKSRAVRLAQYASFYTLLANIAIGLKVGAFPFWWVLVGSIPIVLLALFDSRMFKGESAYANSNNEEWQELRKDVKQLLEKESHGQDDTRLP
jgi:hypothetical protein